MIALAPTLAAFSWDPQIRGAGIVVIAVAILMGSVYLLLATNTGAKLGALLAIAGLSGWVFLMAIVWAIFGIGLKGQPPHWEAKEVTTGPPSAAVNRDVRDFPRGWRKLDAGAPELADLAAAADQILAPSTTKKAERGGIPFQPAKAELESPFKATTDYVLAGAYEKGGTDSLLPGGLIPFDRGPFHSAHYAVVTVAPVLPSVDITGVPGKPTADPAKPVTSAVFVRNQGYLRLPSVLIAIAFGIIFAVTCNALHRRDKEIARLAAAAA